MRPNTSPQYHSVGTATERIKATIDVENMAHVMGQLSDPYENRILACIREYSTNARDSHVAAGVADRPIEVTLPTHEHRFLVIQDFGLGLGIDELREVYLSYGASDKRETDLLNGMLGFGSKAASAYAPLGWQVAAVKDGERVLATVARDAEGVPEMSILHRGPTTQSNGVKITIPVADIDVYKFQTEAQGFFRYWDPNTVLVNGEAPETILDDENLIWLDGSVAVRHDPYGSGSTVVMGGVPYRVQRHSAWGYEVTAFVEMGAVEFPLSRETLKMTDVTTETLDDLFAYVDEHLERTLLAKIEAAPTPWDKVAVYQQTAHRLPYQVRGAFDRAALPLLPRMRIPVNMSYRYQVYSSRNAVNYHTMVNPSTFVRNGMFNPSMIASTVVVTHYPYRANAIAPARRYHLRQFASDHGAELVVVLSGGTDAIDFLDGAPFTTRTWAEVVAEYPHPKRSRSGEKRSLTQYEGYRNGAYVKVCESDLPDLAHVLICDSGSRWDPARDQARRVSTRHPEATVLAINGNQTAKVSRLNPGALYPADYLDQERVRAAKDITEDVKRSAHAHHFTRFMDLHGIEDPDLVEMVDVIRNRDAAVVEIVERCTRLNVGIPQPDCVDEIRNRYPLMEHLPRYLADSASADDVVLYLNAKYRETVVETAMAELEAELEVEG